jgi:hypothetical protein
MRLSGKCFCRYATNVARTQSITVVLAAPAGAMLAARAGALRARATATARATAKANGKGKEPVESSGYRSGGGGTVVMPA